MSKVDETVRSINDFYSFLVLWNFDVVVATVVVLIDVLLDLLFLVATWNILNHHICACFKTLHYLLRNYWTNIFIKGMVVGISGDIG